RALRDAPGGTHADPCPRVAIPDWRNCPANEYPGLDDPHRHYFGDDLGGYGNGEQNELGLVPGRHTWNCPRVRGAANRDLGSLAVRRLSQSHVTHSSWLY